MVAGRLRGIAGVEAGRPGRLVARKQDHPGSDVALGNYHPPEDPLRITDLRPLARELDDRHPPQAVTDPGGRGP